MGFLALNFMNNVSMLGRLTANPELRYSQSENPTAVASFSLAVDRRIKKDGAQNVDFINCTAFGKTAEAIERFLVKGSPICVTGRIQVSNYTDSNNNKRTDFRVIVEEFFFNETKEAGDARKQKMQSGENQTVENSDFSNDVVDLDDDLPF